jgi:phosphohistidine swiveling domain-containing protein
METLIGVVQCVINLLDKQPARHGLAGTGVGTRTYTGPVRIARSPEEAVNNVKIGDVLVVPFTTPAYNVILSAVGAIVTVDGGPLCHAAVLARELEIPAVIGASEALAQLRDGMIVEVDPTAGARSQRPTPAGGIDELVGGSEDRADIVLAHRTWVVAHAVVVLRQASDGIEIVEADARGLQRHR